MPYISCRRLEAMWRKIQELGLSQIYSEHDNDTSNWLSHIFGIAYLDPQEIEDSFVFDIMPHAPSDDAACDKYTDYLSTYDMYQVKEIPPELWASTPENSRTNKAAEAFHSQYNAQFYVAHPNIFVCVEVLRPSQPNGVMSSAVSLPNHMFTGQA